MSDLRALPVGTELVGDYRIRRVLGAGGFGITYLAEEPSLARLVTIKEYFPSDFAVRDNILEAVPRSQSCAADYKWGLDRFIDEAQALAKFDHPNIVRVYRYFRLHKTGYMVLHFEEGSSLKLWLANLRRPPQQSELDAIIAPLLDALELIHNADFLHRDIAPDNIIIRKSSKPVLIDFGSARGQIAQHSKTISALVKPGYSPYEQYAMTSRNQGPWTDIYSLAATVYFAICGHRPIDAPSRIVADELKSARDGALSSYRPEFLAAIDKALRLNVTERPQSIAQWRHDLLLARVGDGAPTPAQMRSPIHAEPHAQPPLNAAPRPVVAAPVEQPRSPQAIARPALKRAPAQALTQAQVQALQPAHPPAPPAAKPAAAHGAAGDHAVQPASPQMQARVRQPQQPHAHPGAALSSPALQSEAAVQRARSPDARPANAAAKTKILPESAYSSATRRGLLDLFDGVKQKADANQSPDEGAFYKPINEAPASLGNSETEAKALAAAKALAETKALAAAKEQAKATAEAKAAAQKAKADAKKLAQANALADAKAKAATQAEANANAKAKEGAKALAKAKAETLAEAKGLKKAKAKAESEARALARERARVHNTAKRAARRAALQKAGQASSQKSKDLAKRALARVTGNPLVSASTAGASAANGNARGTAQAHGVLAKRKPPQPQRIARQNSLGWRSLLMKLIIGIGVASAAVAMQNNLQHKLPRFETRGAGQLSSQRTDITLVNRIKAHNSPARAIAFTAGGTHLVSTGADATLKLWNATSGDLIRTIELDDGPATALAVQFGRAVTGHKDGTIALWDLSNGAKIVTFKRNDANIWSVTFLSDSGRIAAAAHDWSVTIWDERNAGDPIHRFEGHKNAVQAISFSHGRSYIASGGADKSVKLWNASTMKLVRTYRKLTDFVTALAFSPDGRDLAAASLDGRIRIFSARSRSTRRILRGHSKRVTALSYAPGSKRYLASASGDGTARLWDTSRGRTIKIFRAFTGPVHAVSFSPDGSHLATAAEDGVLRIWNVRQLLSHRKKRR